MVGLNIPRRLIPSSSVGLADDIPDELNEVIDGVEYDEDDDYPIEIIAHGSTSRPSIAERLRRIARCPQIFPYRYLSCFR
jgi:hypothetical protein